MVTIRSTAQLNINGRTYEIQCDPQDVERLEAHGARLADLVEGIVDDLGQIGDVPLFVLASIQLLDQLRAQKKFNKRYEAGTRHYDVSHNVHYQLEIFLIRLAKRLEKVAEELERQQKEKDDAL